MPSQHALTSSRTTRTRGTIPTPTSVAKHLVHRQYSCDAFTVFMHFLTTQQAQSKGMRSDLKGSQPLLQVHACTRHSRTHSDASTASRVMQVWLSVSVDRQPILKRCKCPALWSEHGKLEMSLYSNFQNQTGSNQNQAWLCGCTFLSGGGDARKERRKKRLKRENELSQEVGG
ncbi:hypothetical protein NQZ68_024744 [Dissostichus eleginoides]|nr:hypothetical protein NQZ68_024744 [Dissostichus eleginoides]